MVTNYPHSIASHDDDLRSTAGEPNVDGLGGRVIDRLRQMYCGLHGHDTLLHFEQEQVRADRVDRAGFEEHTIADLRRELAEQDLDLGVGHWR